MPLSSAFAISDIIRNCSKMALLSAKISASSALDGASVSCLFAAIVERGVVSGGWAGSGRGAIWRVFFRIFLHFLGIFWGLYR